MCSVIGLRHGGFVSSNLIAGRLVSARWGRTAGWIDGPHAVHRIDREVAAIAWARRSTRGDRVCGERVGINGPRVVNRIGEAWVGVAGIVRRHVRRRVGGPGVL